LGNLRAFGDIILRGKKDQIMGIIVGNFEAVLDQNDKYLVIRHVHNNHNYHYGAFITINYNLIFN